MVLGPGHLTVHLGPGRCWEGGEQGPDEGVDFTKHLVMSL